MCGIAGQLSFKTPVQESQIVLMTNALKHRGPDGDGIWVNSNGNIGLGHRRLAILDLTENGRQPMHSDCGRYSITFNGEIYNYIELREDLKKLGVKFVSNSDTEVLLQLYIKHGRTFLKMLNGMFSFAIWDESSQELFCARDRFGEKPFFYYKSQDRFVFASEMKALWAVGVPRIINEESLYDYLMFNIIEHPEDRERTFYESIYKIDAAQCLVIDRFGKIIKYKYWSLDCINQNNRIKLEDASIEFYQLLLDSVKIRMRSDVPIGSSLSGGLDSSAIVCLINQLKNGNQRQTTFSARFKNFEKDEGEYMAAVVKEVNAEAFYTWPDEKSFVSEFQKLCYFQEEPFGSTSIFAQWEVMKLAKANNVTVLLDGQGADEQLAGYYFYFNDYYRNLKKTNSSLFRNELSSYKINYGVDWNKPFVKMIQNEYPKVYQKYRSVKDFFEINQIDDYLNKQFLKRWRTKRKPVILFNTLKESLIHSLTKGGLQELLRYADRNSMAHSREVRLPFLDHRLVEFVLSLPDQHLIYSGYSKYVMRNALHNLLPPKITWRKDKVGFEPPQSKWQKSFSEIKLNGLNNKYFDIEIYKIPFKISIEALFCRY